MKKQIPFPFDFFISQGIIKLINPLKGCDEMADQNMPLNGTTHAKPMNNVAILCMR